MADNKKAKKEAPEAEKEEEKKEKEGAEEAGKEKGKKPEKKEEKGEEGAEEGKGEEGEGEEGAEGTEGAEGEGGEGKKKKKSKKKLILILLIVVILMAVPAALYFLGIIGGGHKKSQPAPQEGAEGQQQFLGEDGMPEKVVYYDLEEFVVNLNVGAKKSSFLKMTVSLELPGESQIPFIEAKLPRIRDSFQIYLRELRSEDLQGSAGIYRLREELLLRINKIVYPSKVNDILFKEILVQ